MNKCLKCNKETNNPKFCSRSCAASYNNKKFPKRIKAEHFCRSCGCSLGFVRRILCDSCSPNVVDWSTVTVGDLRTRHQYQRSIRVRSHARAAVIRSGIELECAVCGYSLHVDVCHRKAIKDFSDEDFVSDVNSLSNLVLLCKNHHWEFDNDFLEDPGGIEPLLSTPLKEPIRSRMLRTESWLVV